MAGTQAGGKASAESNKRLHDEEYLKKYGMTFYQYIGTQGGKYGNKDGVIKGFAARPDIARTVGAKGGSISRRGKAKK